MALVLESRNQLLESVHSTIRENSGKMRTADLDRIVGNKQDVRFAITRLTLMGKIARRKGLGKSGVEYFYHATDSDAYLKFRRMDLQAFRQSMI